MTGSIDVSAVLPENLTVTFGNLPGEFRSSPYVKVAERLFLARQGSFNILHNLNRQGLQCCIIFFHTCYIKKARKNAPDRNILCEE